MDKNKQWVINNERSVYKSHLLEIFEMNCFLPSKNVHHNFYSIHTFNWVNVFAVTEDNKVILVKQHRLGKNQITFETPAGGIDENENPMLACKRELEEETGYTSNEIILLKKISVNPAIQNNTVYMYLAQNCTKSEDLMPDETEEIDIVLMDLEEAFNSLNNDIFDNSLTYLTILLSKNYLLRE